MGEEKTILGSIHISPKAVATIAYQAILQSYGVVGLAPGLFFKENINSLVQNEKARVNKTVLQKVERKRKKLEEEFKLVLMKFVHSKKLKNFYKLVS